MSAPRPTSGPVLGVDAGGTKTDALVVTPDGTCHRVRGPGANHESVGWSVAGERLRAVVEQALDDAGVAPHEVTASAFGLAGLDGPADEEQGRTVVAGLGLGGVGAVGNDAVLVLEAGMRPLTGVALIAGTGMLALARDGGGRVARTFGMGAGHGDWGSGGDVVRAAAVAVAEADLGTGPPTALTALALSRSGAADVTAYVEGVWRRGEHHLVPPDVWDVAAAGDGVALGVADRVATSLAAGARVATGRLDLAAPEVRLAGRVLDPGHPLLHRLLLERLEHELPGCRVERLGVAPVVGAALAAGRLAGWSGEVLARVEGALRSRADLRSESEVAR